MAEAKAKLRHIHIAPRKLRLLADLIRGIPLKEAKAQINFNIKKGALPFLKLLKSAEGSALHDFKMNPDELFIKEIKVDTGPVLKRYKTRARGRAATIRRRTSHVTVVLDEQQKKLKS